MYKSTIVENCHGYVSTPCRDVQHKHKAQFDVLLNCVPMSMSILEMALPEIRA